MSKLTKQGVRDLSHLKGKSKGKPVELPVGIFDDCKHPRHMRESAMHGHGEQCKGCGRMWDWDGNPV